MDDHAARNRPVDELRSLAEQQLVERCANASELSAEGVLRLVSNLEVHQEELEIQNEELRRVQLELEASRDRYSSLFDFAPVGYLTLDSESNVVEANLTAAAMLGTDRGKLIGKSFTSFFHPRDASVWHLHRQRLIDERVRQSCALHIPISVERNRDQTSPPAKQGSKAPDNSQNAGRGDENPAGAWKEGTAHRVFEAQSELFDIDGSGVPMSRTVLIDVTARHEAEEKLERYNEELEDRIERRTAELREAVLQLTDKVEQCQVIEASLIESEQRYRNFIEHTGEGVALCEFIEPISIDLPVDEQVRLIHRRYRFATCNDAFAQLYGFTNAAELIGKRKQDVDGLQENLTQLNRMALREFVGHGYRLNEVLTEEFDRSGNRIFVESNLVGNAGNGYLTHFWVSQHNVTARRSAETALLESESRLRLVTEQAPAVLWATDSKLQITLSTGGALKHLGLEPGELVGQSLYDHLQTDDPESPIIKAHLAALQGSPQFYDLAHSGRTLECRLEPIKNDRGATSGCIGVAWDVTDRLALEASLRESEQRLELVMDAVPAMIGYVDKDERFRYMNGEFERAFQRGRGDMIGKLVAEVLGSKAYKLRQPYIVRALAGESSVSETEMSIFGEPPRLYQVSYVPQSNESGGADGFFVLVVDLAQRIEAERKLRESEEQFRAIVENSHELIAMHDDERMLYLNRAGFDILGLAPDADLSDPSILTLFETAIWHSAGLAASRPASEPCPEMPQKVISQSLQRPDGESIYVEGKGTIILLQGKPVRVTLIRDMTRRKAAEEALAESERVAQERLAELEHLHRNAPIGLCFVDTSMRFVRVNDFLARINGASAEQHIGRTVREILPGLGPEIEAKYQRIFETGEPSVNLEVRGVTPADPGHVKFWLVDDHPVYDNQGNIVGVQSTVLDISERKHAEERFRLAVESAPNAMVMIDHGGRITLVNSETERYFGYDRSELLGEPVEILVPERFRANHPISRHSYFLAPQARSMGAGRELFGLRKDGREFPVEIGLNPIEAPGGPFVLASIIDISRRKATELQLAKHEQSLAHMGRVHLVGEMASGIAHEMNQPLVAISLQSEVCAQLIEQALRPADTVMSDIRERLMQIAGQAKRAGNILQFLRSFVRGTTSSRSTRSIVEVIQQIIERMGAQARDAQVEILFTPNERLPLVMIDQIQIEQVLLNLIRNAFDATQDNEIGDRNVQITVTQQDQSTIDVQVADNGCHADTVDLDKVFESFYTTKPNGMGLGLSICKTIIESHHGQLSVARNEDRGLTFHFTLPATESFA